MQNQTQNPPNPEGKRNSSVPSFTQSLQRCLNLFLNNFFTTHPFKTSNKIFILLFITSCITIYACRERVTPPDVDNKPKPGKRDYTWTIDTLAYPGSFQTLMRDIWASSPTNVYVVGHNDQGGQGTMFRYDGKKWNAVNLGSLIMGGISLSAIYGFGPNDIYAVGERIYDNPAPPPNFLDSSLIIHFDGVRWSEVNIERGRYLQCIYGINNYGEKKIWCGGTYGTTYYYNNLKWKKINTDPKFWFNDFIISSDYAYALAYQVDTGVHDTTWRYFLKWNGSDWQIEEYYLQIVGFVPKFGSISLALINGELYSCGNGIFKYINNQWQKVLTDVYNRNFYDIYGNSRNNIFAVGSRNMVYHYNGFDWKMLEEFPYSNLICSSVWTDGNEVFIVARDGNRTYIYHGK